MTMATNATSNVYSTGFADPNFLDSNQHSAKTDAYGLGISLLMALTGGEPSRGLRSTYEDDVLDMVAGKEGAGGGLLHAARRSARSCCSKASCSAAASWRSSCSLFERGATRAL